VIFLASYLASKRELLSEGVGRWGLPRAKDLGPLLLAWGLSLAVLFLERDMGASLLLFGVFVVMLWVATGRLAYLTIGVLLFALGAFLGYLAFSHVQLRVDYWLRALEPATVHDYGYYQLAQSWFALASGGMVGTGLGQGSPTLIPYVGSDFIFSAFGEELGMLGTSALLLLYMVFIGRGLRIAMDRTDPFGTLLAVGITTTLALQTFVIVAGVTRLIPLTGVPLPLVSYGGTSKVATFVMLGLLLRTSSGVRS
jgi:cell division protein FtsW (lipid II flippase)